VSRSTERSSGRRRADATGAPLADQGRRIVWVMVFRSGLVTLLFGLLITLSLVSGSPVELASTYSQGMFAVVVLAYFCSLIYALLYRRIRHRLGFFVGQVVVDAVLVSTVVHLTGGLNSVWTFLYPLLVVEAAIVDLRRGALWAGLLVVCAFVLTALAGYGGILPVLEGQANLPWKVDTHELGTALLMNLAAQAAIAVLSAFLAGQLRQVSDRVAEQQEAIRDIVQLNDHIVKSLHTGLITLDPDGQILSANPAAERLLGPSLRTSSQLGRLAALPGLDEIQPGQEAKRWRTELDTGPEPDAARRPVEVTVTPLYDDAGQRSGSIVLVEDLSAIERMEQRVQHAERLAAIGRLAAGIAHEIRNPLASVSGSLELLQSAPDASEEDRRLMQIALREVERLNGLVANLLSYARPRPPQPMIFDLTELVQELLTVAARDPAFDKVRMLGPEPLERQAVTADPNQLRQVLWNLLRNAAEAMPEGGSLRVELGREDTEPAGTWIRISDSGRGMDEETRAQIFEPFFTTKDKGTGLGLATVFRIVQDHDGHITVDSQPGRGTTFTVRLPKRPRPSSLQEPVADIGAEDPDATSEPTQAPETP